MSKFAQINAMESADNELTNNAPAVPEDETATHETAETAAAADEVAQESADAEDLGEEQEQLEEAGEIIEQESAGLTPEASRYLNLALTRIVGKQAAAKIATESHNSGRAAQEEAKRIALEGIKDTLKSFWNAIKAQLKKFYAKVKTFFVKMFSGAKKLAERAKKLQEKANNAVGTIEEKSFNFSQTKAIAVNGKYSEASSLLTGLHNIQQWMDKNLTVKKSEDYENVIEKTQTAVESAIKDLITTAKAGGKSSVHDRFDMRFDVNAELNKAGFLLIQPLTVNSNVEEKLKKMYVNTESGSTEKVDMSQPLPGGKAIFKIYHTTTGKGDLDLEAGIKQVAKGIKNSRLVLGNDKYNPSEVSEGDVKTLTTSQIDKVCDDIIEIGETSYTYEKAWERRDKFQAKLEREIDQIIKEVDQEDDDKVDSKFQRAARQYAESFTASVRRRTTFESQFISYALSTGNAFLNYAERSLAQHKSK